MVLGFPSWVFWGIALPWLGSNLAIILFVCFGMAEDPLDAHESSETDTTSPKGESEK